jgi:hypothetical protein
MRKSIALRRLAKSRKLSGLQEFRAERFWSAERPRTALDRKAVRTRGTSSAITSDLFNFVECEAKGGATDDTIARALSAKRIATEAVALQFRVVHGQYMLTRRRPCALC